MTKATHNPRRVRLCLAAALVSVAGGCAGPHENMGSTLASATRTEVEIRAARVFDTGVLYKPGPGPTNPPALQLAPLIIQEVEPNARLATDNRLNPPAVGFATTEVSVHGQAHAQIVYLWSRPDVPGRQGVRITLNSAGVPVVWEPLSGEPNERVLFVVESLERAALAELGPPLPGRRYAVERAVQESPHVIVARVIADGPIAMGPIVYLEAHTHKVSTVLCRCMPAQVQQVTATAEYDLEPLDKMVPSSDLDGCLRWPLHF